MLYVGQCDLYCLAPGGQNGGSLSCSIYLVPDDGEEHWNSATRRAERSDGLPWAVFVCRIKDYLGTWYGASGLLGSRSRGFGERMERIELEVGRFQAHQIAPEVHLSTRITESRRGTALPQTIDRIDFSANFSPEAVAGLLVASDVSMEAEYSTCTMDPRPPPTIWAPREATDPDGFESSVSREEI